MWKRVTSTFGLIPVCWVLIAIGFSPVCCVRTALGFSPVCYVLAALGFPLVRCEDGTRRPLVASSLLVLTEVEPFGECSGLR